MFGRSRGAGGSVDPRRWRPSRRRHRSLQPANRRPSVTASSPRSPRNANYAITARLDPRSRTLTGDEILTWRNTSNRAATTLRFHLYYNAWRNTNSTWMRERRLAGDTPLTSRPEADWGWIDVTNVGVIGAGGAAGAI